ncbi:MAG: hypothetical protein HC925_06720 [Coleofasciculaceae cyanobacterium SM2_3_26]|nr:hypothetical protein [Coleofasciculaceae cyanobacterium SM2_3_26]
MPTIQLTLYATFPTGRSHLEGTKYLFPTKPMNHCTERGTHSPPILSWLHFQAV